MSTLKEVQENTLEKADTILDEKNMPLEEKLALINKMVREASKTFNQSNPSVVPIDPMDALACDGCQ